MLGRLIKQSSHYAIGSLLVTLASVISFPIFTRTFSVAEYGALNLISSALLLWTGIGKLGVQHSIVRFHAEIVGGSRKLSEADYISTILVGMFWTGLGAALGLALVTLVIPASFWDNETVAKLILPVSVLVVIRVLDSGVSNLVRAQQRSLTFVIYNVVRKYASLAIILIVMFNFLPQLPGFYLGTFIAEFAALAILVIYIVRKDGVKLSGFSSDTQRAMISFGLPMIAFELSGIVLSLGDRYVIQTMLGGEALGQYSASYNLSEYLQIMLMASFAQAILPIYLRMWEQNGVEETRAFIQRALRLYIAVGVAVLAGMTAVGTDVLTLLASEKYVAGAIIIPYVVAGMLIDGAIPILGAGIYIHKTNRLLIPCMMFAAALNIGLNILLIPHWGIVAAAASTLICYFILAALAWHIGARQFRIKFPMLDLIKFGVLAAIMYLIVSRIQHPNTLIELVSRIVAGVVIYAVLVWAFDRDARNLLTKLVTTRSSVDSESSAPAFKLHVLLKKWVKTCLATPLGWRMYAVFRSKAVIVITYHRINDDNASATDFPGLSESKFRAQMEWIKKNCDPIQPENLFDPSRKRSRLKPTVLITFDDGYRDYHDRAYPILKELGIPALVFLSTDFIDRGGLIWTEAIHRAVMLTTKQSARFPWNAESTVSIADIASKLNWIREAKSYLKGIPNPDREQYVQQIFEDLGVPDPTANLDRQMMTWDEVRATMSVTRFGGHSHTHPILSRLSEDEMRREVENCYALIAKETGQAPKFFAYPNGRAIDFNNDVKRIVKESGFTLAFSTIQGSVHMDADPLAVPRQHSGADDLGSFAALVARA
jgi:O-antigen/teichoic acid export membrane protein/peptidoglycan/xylan/chitin deacetylase (PgdA/CDA1 family)